ncbi:glycerol-3-phosphate dehydrogenase-like protein [Leptomonas seymouri]|uniref:Glycerol-3-phosphate dehydrogenase-like protein n=1 Tax=Leptomonas seymouri TaxID=5684 RepID=A0A0N0P4L0_LEPSE|nr:glycerol-3-phosphate dehydrogenase-like protein [Leptomonas seymouri]|eukprot:KPI84947.1 glycerol-3-phosphate dehydrogenase-like protein [Leptomonas seymouri]
MSRKSRRLHVRLARVAAITAGAAFIYQRWQLRSFGVHPASAYHSSSPLSGSAALETAERASTARSRRWSSLQSSSPSEPFDVLVVGGGLTGLYTAVDAAQRGLRVALVDAGDIGGGETTSHMPTVSPGAFPYVQRAIRQRDADWLRAAVTLMEEETTWRNVAAPCVMAPDTLSRRACTRLTRIWNCFNRGEEVLVNGGPDVGVTPRKASTLLPALHTSEMLEYVCAAVLSTALSVFCGPMLPVSILSTSAVVRCLPALSANASSASECRTVRVKGGIVTGNMSIESHTAAVALASTAEQLGVVLCTYAPVVRIQEGSHNSTDKKFGGDAQEQKRQHRRTPWWFGRSVEQPSAGGPSAILIAHVRDALASDSAVDQSSHAVPPSMRMSFLSRWMGLSDNKSVFSAAAPLFESHKRGTHPLEATTSPSSSTVVYARSIVNCSGCSVDAVKELFDGNARDTVPAAFAGYLMYSYLVVPADAVYATTSAAPTSGGSSDATDGGNASGTSHAVHSPLSLSQSTRATGLHFSSPRLSFASAMVLPWWDRCVLLGPSISPTLRQRSSEDVESSPQTSFDAFATGADGASASTVDGAYAIQSRDGYWTQQERIVSILASCGVSVDTSRLLSCVSHVVPYMKSPKEVPFQSELLSKGYALRFSSVPVQESEGEQTQAVNCCSPSQTESSQGEGEAYRDVALLHVYGGSPVLARRIAEDAVNALVHHPSVFDAERLQQLYRCRTRRLQLTMPPSLLNDAAAPSSSHPTPDKNAMLRLQSLILDGYVERLVDVVARRTHVAYTSPEDAMQALPSIAMAMSVLKGWPKERTEAEVEAARRLIVSVAVAAPAAAS